MRLVILDMDSTFIQQEVIDLLANHAGVGARVATITDRAMRGEIDFKQSLAERVALLGGLSVWVLDEVRKEISLTKGALEMVNTLHEYGHKVAVVSGGFENVIRPILQAAKIDFFRANVLETMNGFVTGRTIGPIIDREAKANYLREIASDLGIPMTSTVAVGDGANDLGMLEIAGLSIAFNAKPIVKAVATSFIDDGDLTGVLRLMGIS